MVVLCIGMMWTRHLVG